MQVQVTLAVHNSTTEASGPNLFLATTNYPRQQPTDNFPGKESKLMGKSASKEMQGEMSQQTVICIKPHLLQIPDMREYFSCEGILWTL